MQSSIFKSPITRLIIVLSVATVVALILGACTAPKPVVTKTVTTDDKGRRVSHYRICETSGLPYMEETACRTEMVVHNYCYRTLGRIDCYENPIPGRSAMRFRE